MKKILIASLLITGLFAQDRGERQRPEQRGPEDQTKQEQRDNRKQVWLVATQTEHLKLTPEQAEKFFPLQREYHAKVEKIKKEHRTRLGRLRTAAKDDRSKFDADAALKVQMSVKRAMLDEHEEFLNSAKNVLEKDQWMKLIYFEDTIRKRMSEGAKNKQQDMKKMRPNNHRPDSKSKSGWQQRGRGPMRGTR